MVRLAPPHGQEVREHIDSFHSSKSRHLIPPSCLSVSQSAGLITVE